MEPEVEAVPRRGQPQRVEQRIGSPGDLILPLCVPGKGRGVGRLLLRVVRVGDPEGPPQRPAGFRPEEDRGL